MDNSTLHKAEELHSEALEYYLGIVREKNLIRAKYLLEKSAELGLAKSINLLGDWYFKDILPNKEYTEAVAWYKRGCKLGDGRSMFRLATCYDRGIGTPRDISLAIELYTKAYEAGVADACFPLARIYEKGDGVERNPLTAVGWYRKGSEMGDADCTCNLGFCYYKGNGVEKDIDKAKELFLEHSDYNSMVQRNLGIIFHEGTPTCEPDEEKAVYWLTRAANNGSVSAMLNLGEILRKKNRETAMDWYEKAAKSGNKKGAYQYAFFLYKYGPKEKWELSFKWMKKAAEGGHVAAQFMLGLFYKCEVGTPIDYVKAFYWFNLAAENGYEQAFSHIGRFYRDGRVVAKNYETALNWFEKAIPSKDKNVRSEALFDYGYMYLEGYGVKKNKNKAIDYLKQSKELGCLNAIKKLEELGNPDKSLKTSNRSSIIDHGDIIEYVRMKINDGQAGSLWVPNVLEKLVIHVQCIKESGIAQETEDGRWKWTLSNKDFAQWILMASDKLKLYWMTDKKQRRYYPFYFAKLFISKKGECFNPEALRHDMSAINNTYGDKDVKNYDKIKAAINKAEMEIKGKGL